MKLEGLDETTIHVVSRIIENGKFEGRLYSHDLNNLFPHIVAYVIRLVRLPRFKLGLIHFDAGELVHESAGVKTNFTPDLLLEIVSTVMITSPVSAQAIVEMVLQNASDRVLVPAQKPKLDVHARGALARTALSHVDLSTPKRKLYEPTVTSKEALQALLNSLEIRKKIRLFAVEIARDAGMEPFVNCLIDTSPDRA